jgi:hypothetical protein
MRSDFYDYVTASTTGLQTSSTKYETRPKHPLSSLKFLGLCSELKLATTAFSIDAK